MIRYANRLCCRDPESKVGDSHNRMASPFINRVALNATGINRLCCRDPKLQVGGSHNRMVPPFINRVALNATGINPYSSKLIVTFSVTGCA